MHVYVTMITLSVEKLTEISTLLRDLFCLLYTEKNFCPKRWDCFSRAVDPMGLTSAKKRIHEESFVTYLMLLNTSSYSVYE